MERQLQRFLDGFTDIVDTFQTVGDFDSDQLADRWRMLTIGEPDRAALGYEFTLFLLRNPEARERVAAAAEATARSLADYIDAHLTKIGARLRVPSMLLAKVLIATYEGVTLGSHIDSENLYRPYLEMVMAHVEPAESR